MFNLNQVIHQDLGKEPIEVLGFESEEELDLALFPLMQTYLQESHKDN
tara:strand:- start:412 stop:555 length:144 start_codon:yes stop_codon:yes gene_type:complete